MLPLLIWQCHDSATMMSGISVSPFSLGWTSDATGILPGDHTPEPLMARAAEGVAGV